MRALVTGGTGFIGSHIVEKLVTGGTAVRVLVRRSSDTACLQDFDVELVYGDLKDVTTLSAAVKDVDVVYHNAATVSDWGPWETFAEITINGTAHLLAAAAQAGVPRFVHMSSAAVYGYKNIRGRTVTEDFPLAKNVWRWDYYSRAKIEAERLVLQSHAAGKIAATILRPVLVYGPRDRAVFPRLAALLRKRRLVIIGSGHNRPHLVYVGDVANAALLAGTREAAVGQAYNIDGRKEITQRQYLNMLAEMLGTPKPRMAVPLSVMYSMAFLQEAWGHLRHKATGPTITRYFVLLAGGETHFDTSKAERELGWEPHVSIQEGLSAMAQWYKKTQKVLS
jgi:nucleoside-diphosphate-sugar epimerase